MNNKNIINTQKPFSLSIKFLNSVFSSVLTFILTAILSINTAYAAPVAATYSAVPPLSAAASTTTPPLAMLVMSNDEKLYTKAYTDYDDILDESVTPAIAGADGKLEITYTDVFDYLGYFNNKGCYSFGSGVFSPTATVAGGANKHHCAATEWSGNFLNWVSMTKMDIIRKVLFGGARSTDTVSSTILERAYIPKDAHAFVKVFKTATTADMQLYTPFSSTSISLCNVSHASSGLSHGTLGNATPPSIRVANGNWERWSSSEVAQCEWSDDTGANITLGNLPKSGVTNDELGTFTARVEVCVAGLEEDNCTSYTNTTAGANFGDVTKKPTGLLQDYGINSKMKFGLISGSYVKNNSGGVLRKNISSIEDEINSDDGTFKDIAGTTRADGSIEDSSGIIKTISSFRIISYNTGTKKYDDCNTHSIKVSEFLGNAVGNECRNWGNPITEMYLEALRYFSGKKTPSTDFDADDSGIINTTNGFDIKLDKVVWDDPLTVANQCAECSIIIISSGLNSFDMDELSSAADVEGLSGAADVITKTNLLNTLENITGDYFIGSNDGTVMDETCNAKSLTSNLGDARGLCNEEPYAQGGFGIAGLSYHALLTDFRTGGGFDKKQTVNTYAVALSRGLPTFTIPTSTSDITIMPSCQANTNGNANASTNGWNQCSLVDLQVINPTYVSNKLVSAKLRIHYEDSHWGNDLDMDGVADIDFCVGSNCSPSINADQIKIVVTSPTAAAGNALRFGYLIGGTTADGPKFPLIRKGGDNFNSIAPGGDAVRDCSQAPVSDITECTTTFTAGTSNIKTLKPPLWYAAKWGGFTDVDGDDLPNLTREWDAINNTTNAFAADGIPDNYFQADNPAVLEKQVKKIFKRLLNRVSSGSAAAVITDSVSTVGAVYQALYQPEDEFNRKKVSWIGQLHGIFIDGFGHLREDTNENKRLDLTDKFILVKFTPEARPERTLIWYCDPNYTSSNELLNCGVGANPIKEIYDLKPIWNANYELAKFSALDARLYNHRDYATPFLDAGNGGRHILTWQDLNGDNEMDSGEVVPFTAANFMDTTAGVPTKAGLLGIDDSGVPADDLAEINNVVNFVRGLEDPANTGYRNRTINFEKDLSTPERVWRMGDIVHSSPTAVGPPTGTAYGTEIVSWEGYGDDSYVAFKNQYKNRRTVVYVGGNDGLVHAFNAGFYVDGTKEYCLDKDCVNDASSSHTLGAELWAYAPRNLLPQLKFLTEPNYPHAYYMDGEPRTFDVNLWPATGDTKHPGGWGTILVVGMGFGGGAHAPITVDVDNTATTTFETNSGYVFFDVTDPEVAPTVLGEFTHPDLGFTTSIPSLLVKRSPDANDNWANAGFGGYPNVFGLVFGSGPNKLDTALSDQNAKLFMIRLKLSNGVLDLNNASNQLIVDTGEANSFIGDPLAKNWNNDFLFDAVYFGTAGGTELVPNGKLMRIALNTNDISNWTLSTVLDTNQPFLNMPVAKEVRVVDVPVPERWIFAGTGRFFTSIDGNSATQQSFYGIKEKMDAYPLDYQPLSTQYSINPVDANYLQDVTDVKVFKQGEVEIPAALVGELPGVTDFDLLEAAVNTKEGWRINFTIPLSAERDLARATPLQGLIIFPTFVPNVLTCDIEGFSYVYGVYERTGTGFPGGSFESPDSFFGGDATNPEALPKYEYGTGLVSEITAKRNEDNTYTLVCTVSTGEICNLPTPGGAQCRGSACEASTGRQSWREILLF